MTCWRALFQTTGQRWVKNPRASAGMGVPNRSWGVSRCATGVAGRGWMSNERQNRLQSELVDCDVLCPVCVLRGALPVGHPELRAQFTAFGWLVIMVRDISSAGYLTDLQQVARLGHPKETEQHLSFHKFPSLMLHCCRTNSVVKNQSVSCFLKTSRWLRLTMSSNSICVCFGMGQGEARMLPRAHGRSSSMTPKGNGGAMPRGSTTTKGWRSR